MRIGIIGGGLSGLSLAYFLQDGDLIRAIEVLEKEPTYGGLCRSYELEGIPYDVGPHILFSKDEEILKLMIRLLGENVVKLRRSNKICYRGRFVKYPFENELSALPEEDKQHCLATFLNNPYESYTPENMLQFFLATFGEGITNIYLRPYNEKIWKFDPAFMDTQMVERIPKPPRKDIIKSAEGLATEGYLHQLHFYYPRNGGIASMVDAFAHALGSKVTIWPSSPVRNIERAGNKWHIEDETGRSRSYDKLVSTMPAPDLIRALGGIVPDRVRSAAADLKSNSIVIMALNVKKDSLSDNFAIMVPDKRFIFHRLSKLNFMGDGYVSQDGSSTLLVEITYRKEDSIDKLADSEIKEKVIDQLSALDFIEKEDCNFAELKRFPYAYVIYDLNHRKNMSLIRDFCEQDPGLFLNGRFGTFEYLNMDAVVRQSKALSKKIKGMTQ